MSSNKKQIAVVTGASSGIGKAITLQLARNGFVVGMIGRSLTSLEAVGGNIKRIAKNLIPFQADLGKNKDIQSLVTRLTRTFDEIDILVHSAGLVLPGDISMASIRDFDLQYRVNIRAPYVLTAALLPLLKARKGQVVFINSSAGLHAKAGSAAYSASKHALKAVADALRDEVNPEGIRVISVFPGRTATPMQDRLSRHEGLPYAPEDLLQPGDVAQTIIDALGLNRTAEITDISIRPVSKDTMTSIKREDRK